MDTRISLSNEKIRIKAIFPKIAPISRESCLIWDVLVGSFKMASRSQPSSLSFEDRNSGTTWAFFESELRTIVVKIDILEFSGILSFGYNPDIWHQLGLQKSIPSELENAIPLLKLDPKLTPRLITKELILRSDREYYVTGNLQKEAFHPDDVLREKLEFVLGKSLPEFIYTNTGVLSIQPEPQPAGSFSYQRYLWMLMTLLVLGLIVFLKFRN